MTPQEEVAEVFLAHYDEDSLDLADNQKEGE
jgi:hypothetical protein